MDLSEKIAIVTGGGQGIGREVSLKLSQVGASIVVCDINLETAKIVSDNIKANGGKSIAIQANIASTQDVNEIVNQTLSSFNRIDILVNNAGITRDNLILRMSEIDWDQVLAINLKGAFLCTQAVLKAMIKQRWGRIINIASVVGRMGNAGQANYASAKAGLIGLTKSIAKEVASRNITANAIAPGFIDTGMTSKLSDNVKQEALRQIPIGAFGQPADVANAVAFFASEESHYITGQVLNVDGGMFMA